MATDRWNAPPERRRLASDALTRMKFGNLATVTFAADADAKPGMDHSDVTYIMEYAVGQPWAERLRRPRATTLPFSACVTTPVMHSGAEAAFREEMQLNSSQWWEAVTTKEDLRWRMVDPPTEVLAAEGAEGEGEATKATILHKEHYVQPGTLDEPNGQRSTPTARLTSSTAHPRPPQRGAGPPRRRRRMNEPSDSASAPRVPRWRHTGTVRRRSPLRVRA